MKKIDHSKIFLIVCLIILIYIIINSSIIKGIIIDIRSPITRCKIVKKEYQEPYKIIEEVMVPKEYEIELKYRVDEALHRELTKEKEKGKVVITNIDSETGVFTVKQVFKGSVDNVIVAFKTSKQIMPGESVQFIEEFNKNYGEDVFWDYKVIPGKKKVTKLVPVKKEVTRYRPVYKDVIEC